MTPADLANELGLDPKTLRAWLRREWPRQSPGTSWSLTEDQIAAARQRWSPSTGTRPTPDQPRPTTRGRRDASDEQYVLDLLDDLLDEPGIRQHTFDWLLGDAGRTGSQRRLPVDGYWPAHRLVVEYRERQHDQPVAHFDKPGVLTISGVHRGEQRRRYDNRRDQLIPAHGLTLLVVKPDQLEADSRGRLRRAQEPDREALRRMLHDAQVT